MALTRRMLKAMGIDEEKVEEIITAHTEVTNALKKDIDDLKDKADKYDEEKKRADNLQKTVDSLKDGDGYEEKYNDLKKEYSEYKAGVEKAKAAEKDKEDLKTILQGLGIPEKRIPSILKVADFSKIKRAKDGTLENEQELKDALKEEWADFITTTTTEQTKPATPPTGGGKKMTREEIRAIKDPVERQKAIADNHELYGI